MLYPTLIACLYVLVAERTTVG